MANQNWQKAKEIFNDALQQRPEDRLRFLDEIFEGDTELRREVESLLDSYNQAESFMETPAADEFADVIIQNKTDKQGKYFGHYEILKLIGVGGMGEVYLAEDKKLDRHVAIKILNESFSRHESNLNRFTQEAKSASALNHPNILVIHEIGISGDAHYIVSEFIEGNTLRELIEVRPMKLPDILDIVMQTAGALVAAHTAKIIHRDIKPENIMVRPDGYVKVLDFGLAKLIEQKNKSVINFEEETVKQNQTAKGLILGTVNYMSPEQAKGEKVDERTDIFSFGTLIYEMIAGRTPFADDSMSETFANLINAEPQPLSRFTAGVPDELQRIVSKTLKKNKNERYQTMKDLLADLKVLRENFAVDRKFGKLHSAATDKNATAPLPAPTDSGNKQTGEIQRDFLQKIKKHKPLVAVALVILLISAISLGYYLLNTNVKKSLAVLPFTNLSQDPNAEYMSDGITESIINNLSQLSGLKVMSRNSAFRFKNNQSDTRNIASQLGVETLVTGDIKQLGDKLVINVRLIKAADDSQIWGQQYVRTSADVITAQNEIAQAVANNLRLKLSNTDQQRLGKKDTENVEADQLYQRGRFHVFKLTPPEVQKGITYFNQAIELDPHYALAYVGLADAYRSLAVGSEISPAEFLSKSKVAAQKAIEIDDSLSEAHTTLGMTIFWGEWDWAAAETQYKRALELNPNDENAHLFYAHFLSNTGHHTEALAEVKLARELDPLFPFSNALEGQFLMHAGKVDEALDRLRNTFELDPNFWMPHVFASSAYIEKGMYEEAITEARKSTELSAASSISLAFEGYALTKLGRNDQARVLLNKLLKLSTERSVPPYHIALIYNGLGEKDETMAWLEKSFQQHDPKMTFLKVEPKWNNLRSDPRFQDLMKRMNFSQ